jgi:hypothetical protein
LTDTGIRSIAKTRRGMPQLNIGDRNRSALYV